jgi:hypothetical protein
LLAVACSDPEASNNGQTGQACESDFDCPLPLECGDDGFCVDNGNTDMDAGDEDAGTQDTGDDDTGTEDTGTEDTGTEDTGTEDTGDDDTATEDATTDDTGTEDVTDDAGDTTNDDTGTQDASDTTTDDTGTQDATDTTDDGSTQDTTDTTTQDTSDTTTQDTSDTTTQDTSDTTNDTTDTTSDAGDTTADTSTDTGGPAFSGCTTNFDCDGYQTCNTSIGRCEDSRPSCSTDSDCTSGVCLAGRCAPTCNATNPCQGGLDCFDVGLQSGDGACLAYCGTDGAGNTYSCGPDTQCMPYFGIGEGLCRGVGSNATGDTCTDDFGADDCQSGSFCLDDRGTKTCRSFCSASGSPGCSSGDFCRIIFPDDQDPTNSVGVCEIDCGGIGNTDDTLCPGSEVCQPTSANNGFCTTQGTVAEGGTCYYDGTGYCEVGLTCAAAGTNAPTDPTEGRCTSLCDPTLTSGNNVCGQGEACIAFADDPGIGACRTTCDPGVLATSNVCSTSRPRCLPSDQQGVDGTCSVAGPLANGATCDLASPLNCGADDLCVIANDPAEPYGGGDTGSGTCTRYCESFQFASGTTSTRCGSAEVCAARYLGLSLGFCTTNKTSTTLAPGDSCTSAQTGMWCDDDVLCQDWDQTGNPRCEIPCDTTVSGTCPSGQTCQAVLSSGTAGYCQ